MPYIKQLKRDSIDSAIERLPREMKPGDLNYAITRILNRHLIETGVNYTALNELVGVLECAKLEFNRRMIAPYEDTKIKENGDAYDAQS